MTRVVTIESTSVSEYHTSRFGVDHALVGRIESKYLLVAAIARSALASTSTPRG